MGLGNPGAEYAGNRHNVGFMVADLLVDRLGGRFKRHKHRAEVAETRLGGTRVVVGKPRSAMNTSGGAVASLADYYRLAPGRIVVIHDELDLAFGALRLKLGGGDNGHNGLRSVRAALGTGDFYRVRFGIGRPPGQQDPADFVLSNFSGRERKELPALLERAADAVEALVTEDLATAQNRFNG